MLHLINPYLPRREFLVAANRGSHLHDYGYKIEPVYEQLIGGKILLGYDHRCKCGEGYVDGLSIPQVIPDAKND